LVELTALVSDARAIKHKPIDKIRIIEIGSGYFLNNLPSTFSIQTRFGIMD